MSAGPDGIPAIVLGGSGYVAGELLRLLAGHPRLDVAGVMSESRSGQEIRDTFPQLQNSLGALRFGARDDMLALLKGRVALFSAAPHGASAGLIASFVDGAERSGCDLTVVDVSADFRYANAAAYEAVYGQPHGAPQLLDRFACALPEHLAATDRSHIGHPGCFATSLLLAAVPLLQLGLAGTDLFAVGITGSTGSGRAPAPGTHHPERHSNLFAYKPLAHRHAPEVVGICHALTGRRPSLRFIPHSGPFARGIHMTVQAPLQRAAGADDIRDALSDFYAESPFIAVQDGTPRVKNVVGSNYAHIGVAADANTVAVLVVIDNLVKGAAGGAVQWMNRQLGLRETTGLTAPSLAWT
ncbi:MAG: N-acetyl-gamma-glutamyl-phosphate reductase [Gammaproteobacteria bacterium]